MHSIFFNFLSFILPPRMTLGLSGLGRQLQRAGKPHEDLRNGSGVNFCALPVVRCAAHPFGGGSSFYLQHYLYQHTLTV